MQLVFAIHMSKVIVNNLHNKFLPFLWDPLRKEYHIEINKRRNNTIKIKIANSIKFIFKVYFVFHSASKYFFKSLMSVNSGESSGIRPRSLASNEYKKTNF